MATNISHKLDARNDSTTWEVDDRDVPRGFSAFVVAFMAAAIALNLSLNPLMLFVLRRVTSIQPTTKVFMASLTLADFLTGASFLLRLQELIAGRWLLGGFLCAFKGAAETTLQTLHVVSLLLLTADRYAAICRPLRYPSLVTVCRAKLAASATWAVTVVAGVLIYGIWTPQVVLADDPQLCVWVMFQDDWRMYASLVGLFLSLVLILLMYAHIFVIARRHARQISLAGARVPGTRDQRQLRSSLTVGIVAGALVVSWLPHAATLPVSSAQGARVELWALGLTDTLMMSNGWLNVIVYYLRNQELRRAVHDLLLAWRRCTCMSDCCSRGGRG